jgi:hypothetical protein
MYAQFSDGFPGVVIESERIYVDSSKDLDKPLEQLYSSYLEDKFEKYAINSDHAAGLHAFLERKHGSPFAAKGQITGPVTWGLAVTDENRRPLLYNDTLADAMAKHLHLKAAWQEREIKAISPNTIIFVDEPYMASIGSAFVSISSDKITRDF